MLNKKPQYSKRKPYLLACGLISALLLLFSLSSNAVAEEQIAEFSSGPLSFSLSLDDGDYQLLLGSKERIANSEEGKNARVFTLQNPARLILDLPFVVELTKAEVKVNNSIVSGVRFGSHPGKTRIVLDLNENSAPIHTLREDPAGDALALRFWFPQERGTSEESFRANLDEAIRSRKSQEEAKVAATKTATLRKTQASPPRTRYSKQAEKPKVAKKAEKKAEPSYLRARLDTPLPAIGAAATRVPGGVVIRLRSSNGPQTAEQREFEGSLLKAIQYIKTDKGKLNAIRIEVSNLQNYLLERVNEEEYALRLFGTKEPARNQLRALCAPDGSENLQVIIPTSDSRGTVLDIYVQEGTRLRALRTSFGLELRSDTN